MIPSDPMIGHSESAKGIVQNAVIYFPDPYLPQSENLKLIDNISLRFDINHDRLQLDSLKARISNLAIASVNSLELDMEFLKSFKKREHAEMTSDEIFDKLREIRFLHRYFENADEALLTFTFGKEESHRYVSDINLFADASMMIDDVLTQGIYLYGRLVWDGELFVEDRIEGEIQSIRFGEDLKLNDVAFDFQYDRDDTYSLIPNRIRSHSGNLSIFERPFDYFTAVVYPDDLTTGKFEASYGFGQQFLTTRAEYNVDQRQMLCEVRGDINPILLAIDWVGETEALSKLSFEGLPHVSAKFRLKDWSSIEDISFRLVSEGVVLKEVPFSYARARGTWDNQNRSVVLNEFHAARSSYAIEGQLYRSLESTEYRYLIKGTGIPPHLNSMFKPWWSRTWEKFDFKDHPVGVDIDIWGTTNDLSKRNTFGSMVFDDIEYKGLQIDHGEVRINAISKYLDLFDIYIQNENNVASGRVENVYEAKGSRHVSQSLDLYTNIPLHTIAPLVGKDLDPFVNNTKPEAWADVWLKGKLIKDGFPELNHLDDLEVKLHVSEPTWFFGLELDSADAVLHKKGETFRVEPVTFEFAKGRGNGIFLVSGSKPEKKIEFTVNLEDFDFREAVEKIEVFQNKEEVSTAQSSDALVVDGRSEAEFSNTDSNNTDTKKNSGGFKLKRPEDESYMDLTLVGTSPINDLGGMQAVGSFELDDPLIHRVHIFGGFSKVMDNAELNLGSFSLKRATSPLRIDGRMLYLDNLELTGPSSRVRSKGSINMEDGSLNFRLKAYPLGEVKFPVVAGLALVLRPFAHLFEVQVTGTLEEPEVKTVIDPSGL